VWSQFDGLGWLLLALGPLLFLQRRLHREVQAVLLILTRHPAITVGIFSFLFFPGVALHELSHFIMARLLGVRTGGFSLLPKVMPDGRIQLGYLEAERVDWFRDALIGLAPLIAGGLFVAYAAIFPLDLLPLWEALRTGQFASFWTSILLLPERPDFLVWFYLTFAVSSTMLPSGADRHAWLPLGLVFAALIGLAVFAGAGPWMLANLAPPFNAFLRGLALLFGLSAAVHLVLILPLLLIHRLLAKLTGVDVG
jgi:hypothetical protein